MSSHPGHPKKPKTRLFLYLFLLTALLCIWQQSLLIYTKDSYFVLDAIMEKLFTVPLWVYVLLISYWCLQIFLHVVFVLFIGTVAYLSAAYLKLSQAATFKWGILLWIFGVLALFFTNALQYPLSAFSDLILFFLPKWLVMILLVGVLIPLSMSVVLSFGYIFHRVKKQKKSVKIILFSIAVIVVGIVIIDGQFFKGDKQSSGAISRRLPNIFIIGLDAVRPERLGYNGSKNFTPFVDEFLKQATVFDYSLTPLARTYPAWASIVTGLFPKHHGIRFTLTDPRGLHEDRISLASELKKYGYITVFATDGSRFNVMDSSFGFDRTIGPTPGVSNFIMDLVDGSPLLNLIVNTDLGLWLYPNIIGNRDVVFTYEPQKFNRVLEKYLPPNSEQPIFAGIHLNLTHFPYEWANSSSHTQLQETVLYDKSIERIDLQFQSLMNYLKKHHYLDNAMVILMSDHGESFGITGDRLITENHFIKGSRSYPDIFKRLNALQPGNKRIDVASGHGTDVLSMTQYHNVLAIRCYGFKKNVKKRVSDLVSLIDLKPTILAALHVPPQKTDGISLLPYLEGKKGVQKGPRKFFIEIDFTPVAIRSKNISLQNVIFQGIDMFEIMPGSQEIIMKPAMFRRLLRTKQKAMFYGDWLLALYPDKNDQLYPVLVNLKTGFWTDDLTTDFAKNSPANQMARDLRNFYGKEVTAYWRLPMTVKNQLF